MVWFEGNAADVARHDPCGHCEGIGEIEAEVEKNGDIAQHSREGP